MLQDFSLPLLVTQVDDDDLSVCVIRPAVAVEQKEEGPRVVRVAEREEEAVADDPLPFLLKVEHR